MNGVCLYSLGTTTRHFRLGPLSADAATANKRVSAIAIFTVWPFQLSIKRFTADTRTQSYKLTLDANLGIATCQDGLELTLTEIDTIPEEKIDDHDYCPWSCRLDYLPSYVIMSCVWSKANYVHELVQVLARQHGLALYDPQSEKVTYPDSATGRNAKTGMGRSAAWLLGSFALLFAAMFVYSERVAPSRAPLIIYVFAGLCVLMAVACFRQARR